jgi:hypothetical protein
VRLEEEAVKNRLALVGAVLGYLVWALWVSDQAWRYCEYSLPFAVEMGKTAGMPIPEFQIVFIRVLGSSGSLLTLLSALLIVVLLRLLPNQRATVLTVSFALVAVAQSIVLSGVVLISAFASAGARDLL